MRLLQCVYNISINDIKKRTDLLVQILSTNLIRRIFINFDLESGILKYLVFWKFQSGLYSCCVSCVDGKKMIVR